MGEIKSFFVRPRFNKKSASKAVPESIQEKVPSPFMAIKKGTFKKILKIPVLYGRAVPIVIGICRGGYESGVPVKKLKGSEFSEPFKRTGEQT